MGLGTRDMKWFINLGLKWKLIVSFGVGVALIVTLAVVASQGMSRIDQKTAEIDQIWMDGTEASGNMALQLGVIRMKGYNLYVSDAKEHDRIKDELSKAISDMEDACAQYQKTIHHGVNREKFATFTAAFTSMSNGMEKFVDYLDNGKTAEAKSELMGPMLKDYYAAKDSLGELVKFNTDGSEAAAKESRATFVGARNLVMAMGAAAVLLSLFFAFALAKYILKSVRVLSERVGSLQSTCVANLQLAVEAMAAGDMTMDIHTGTKPLDIESRDEFGKLAETFNDLLQQTKATIAATTETQANLSGLVRQIQQASNEVGHAASDLAKTSQDVEVASEEVGASMREIASASTQAARGASEVATGTTTQAQALSESTQNIQRLAASVGKVADDAHRAAEAAGAAGEAATEGTTVVAQSMSGMTAIRETVAQSASVIHTLGESSQKIGTIVQTINEIAEQTNLLALNAAIEAARAGDAGRGFAVVADEVRKLAERSGSATREIGALISEIQERTAQAVSAMEAGTAEVESQTKIAESTQQAFLKIQEVFESVNDRVEGIRQATNQMAEVSNEVSKSISEVAAVVEQSSAAAEELSASAEEVSASVDTVAGAAQQQSAAARELVASSDQLQSLAQGLSEAVSTFRILDETANKASDRPMLRAA